MMSWTFVSDIDVAGYSCQYCTLHEPGERGFQDRNLVGKEGFLDFMDRNPWHWLLLTH